jgi:hypothetical protein
MLTSSDVAKMYWAEAIMGAVDIYNVSPGMGNVKTPLVHGFSSIARFLSP